MAQINWRTVNVDAYDAEASCNFDLSTLTPGLVPVPVEEVQTLANQIRQLSRGGDSEGALRGALENPPYGADDKGKVTRPLHVHFSSHSRFERISISTQSPTSFNLLDKQT